MTPEIIRPKISADRWKELEEYLIRHWDRAFQSRSDQVDGKYERWSKNYRGEPAEKERSFPWPKSSNMVVKLNRMFIDTFMTRTLTIMFSTRPLLHVQGFPAEIRENVEYYLNHKAYYEWKYRAMAKEMLSLGNKNGTWVSKTTYVEDKEWVVNGRGEKEVIKYAGPLNITIPFEDFYVYPITAPNLERVLIKMHRIRFSYEEIRSKINRWRAMKDDGTLDVFDMDELKGWLTKPDDAKRSSQQANSGIVDDQLEELQAVECHLKYPLANDKDYSLVATLSIAARKMVDLYHNPYPLNANTFNAYVPFPQEDLFYGESMCQILDQSQEEVSVIHNDRRNNSMLANTVCFKRRNGSNIPNPSSNWYPGKVWDLEDMTDLDVMQIGRNFNDMIAEENFSIQFAERLLGIGPPMQGSAVGGVGKGGIYNTQGLLGVLSEGNQRQDSNIADAREVIGEIGRVNYLLQAAYGSDDPTVDLFPDEIAKAVRQALKEVAPDVILRSKMTVRSSDSSMNKETRKASLLQLAQVLGQYGTTVSQMAVQLINPQLNPVLKGTLMSVIRMHKWMAATLLRAYDEYDTQEVIPDVERLLAGGGVPEGAEPGQETVGPAMGPAGVGGAQPRAGREFLEDILTLPGGAQGALRAPGMAS